MNIQEVTLGYSRQEKLPREKDVPMRSSSSPVRNGIKWPIFKRARNIKYIYLKFQIPVPLHVELYTKGSTYKRIFCDLIH
jgi:hypothetical protein